MTLTGRVQTGRDAADLAELAADWMIERLASGGERLSVSLAGGSTPRRLYALLAAEPRRSRVPWERIHWFWGDERVVPPDDERSNERMAREALLQGVPVTPSQIHAVPTGLATPEASAEAYQQDLISFYGRSVLDPARPLFDVVLLGIGPDGHTASLFPGKPAVEETSRWVVASEPGLDPRVARITLTLPALASSRATAFLASGADKHAILARIAAGEDLPARRVRADGDLVWFLDQAAEGDGNR